LGQIETLLKRPDLEIDIATVQFTIDKLIDPSVDINENQKEIDRIVSKLHLLADGKQPGLDEIKHYLYKQGPWNDFESYRYNHETAFSYTAQSASLSRYLATKRGDCVSMPLLVYILGRRLGWYFSMSSAPDHTFVRVKTTSGTYCFEATGKGTLYTEKDYQALFKLNKQAQENKIYFQDLSNKEVGSKLLTQLVYFYTIRNEFKKALRACNLAIKYYPKNAAALNNKSAIYGRLYLTRKKQNRKQTEVEIDYMNRLYKLSKKYQLHALNLGLIKPTQNEIEAYQREIAKKFNLTI